MTASLLSPADILTRYGATTARRGKEVFESGAVLDFDSPGDESHIQGVVQGKARQPHNIYIWLRHSDRGINISDSCSCSLEYACPHSAAVLYAYMHALKSGNKALKAPSWLREISVNTKKQESPNTEHILYRLVICNDWRQKLRVEALLARKLKGGGYGMKKDYSFAQLLSSEAKYVTADDTIIGGLIQASTDSGRRGERFRDPEIAFLLFQRVIASGRCFWQDEPSALNWGQPRSGEVQWQPDRRGAQSLRLVQREKELFAYFAGRAWYLDKAAHTFGPLEVNIAHTILSGFFDAPALLPEHTEAAVKFMQTNLPASIPVPSNRFKRKYIDLIPRPTLTLTNCRAWTGHKTRNVALLSFDYDGVTFDAGDEFHEVNGENVTTYKRHLEFEKRMLGKLLGIGLSQISGYVAKDPTLGLQGNQAKAWTDFMQHDLFALKADGWELTIDPSFEYDVTVCDAQFSVQLSEESNAWFSLALGVEVDGAQVSLLPILARAIQQLPLSNPHQHLHKLDQGGRFIALLDNGKKVSLPFARVKLVLETLIELFDGITIRGNGTARCTLLQALGLRTLTSIDWRLSDKLSTFLDRLRDIKCSSSKAPSRFGAELRSYQLDGLAWMQSVREAEIGGILADDMGLGKTVQALAHILLEKEQGRLNLPFLVVCPTSVVPNWLAEAARFAPQLQVLCAHGEGRKERFAKFAQSDLVITTYQLLARDCEALVLQPWHGIILDEAQAIKNTQTQAAQIAAQLKATHRFCLTGTPIENHLGEIWSHFSFLTPGLLGESSDFKRSFRTPIEKHGDELKLKTLKARIQPFILRRTKQQVEKELPEKTTIIKRVTLSNAQRDLYETVRLSMNERVRKEVALKGFANSQITFLAALLKLRQVCCDPRLVNTPAAAKVHVSAKLESLLEMLVELVEAGSRILLFSQFTSMLELIKSEIEALNIQFVELTGSTRDRTTPVQLFQSGKVPLFLISLKAGGTGLNLTAADTVILYDPWWNPAVENQATDRAHRIGQDKPVFVYKLIAEGTVEETILGLQSKKARLAGGVLGDGTSSSLTLTQEDIAELLGTLD